MSKSDVITEENRATAQAPDAYFYLGRFLEDCHRIQSHRFQSREEMDCRLDRLVVQYFGSLEEDGMLQHDINRYYHGILTDLKRDYPRFTRKMILLFSYTAARLPRSLICAWAHISSEGAVSSLRSRMKNHIFYRIRGRREEYLDLLSR
ncbi:MAG: hypothetical protein IK008_01915 [Bacteroidales bacterium]|nr:hypothetical protein [Bacteroidales bacterium]